MAKAKDSKSKSPLAVLQALRAEHNSDHATIGTLDEFGTVEGFSAGNISIDSLTGVGGYPKGRIVEQHGEFSSGKTTSALQAMAVEQQRIIKAGEEKFVMFLDYERSIDPEYCSRLGLDVGHQSFIYVKPKNFEHGANIFRQMLDTGAVSIAVFDSVAAMVSEKEQQAETGKANVADRAKMMHQFLRQITSDCEKHGTTPIFLNHTMEKVDTTAMGQRLAAQGIKRMTQPGGTALPFYASLRLEFKKVQRVKSTSHDVLTNEDDKRVTAQDIQVTVVKNKVGAAFGTAKLRVRFGKGFSQPYSVLQILKSHGAVKVKAGGYHTFSADLTTTGEDRVIQGEDATLSEIEGDPAWLAVLLERAQALISAHGVEEVDSSLYDSNGQAKAPEEGGLPLIDSEEGGLQQIGSGESGLQWADPDEWDTVNKETGEVL